MVNLSKYVSCAYNFKDACFSALCIPKVWLCQIKYIFSTSLSFSMEPLETTAMYFSHTHTHTYPPTPTPTHTILQASSLDPILVHDCMILKVIHTAGLVRSISPHSLLVNTSSYIRNRSLCLVCS